MEPSLIPTDLVPVLSSVHGRQRRKERNIDKKQLQAAVKYGTKERAGNGRWKYKHNGIVYITDATSQHEVTSWNRSNVGGPSEFCKRSGFCERLSRVHISNEMRMAHFKSLQELQDHSTWTSHTVVVLDQSGSMRKRDTSEGATRSEVVWLVLAINFVAKTLQDKERQSSDVFSLVIMRETAQVVLKCRPFDWLLYNDLIHLSHDSDAGGHGNYWPSLEEADRLLTLNNYGGCALALLFFSDGRPSDCGDPFKARERSLEQVTRLASEFGRRLTIGAIAIGPKDEDFAVLKSFASVAEEYGSAGLFHEASLSADDLSKTLASLTAMVSATITEMTVLGASRHRQVRKVAREPVRALGGTRVTAEWYLCKLDWTNYQKRPVVRIRWDPRGGRKNTGGWEVEPNTFQKSDAVGVAFKKKIFAEGAERIVREFREVGPIDFFVGHPLVAKESRFVEESEDLDKRDFHRVFCKTQQLAQTVATAFNEAFELVGGIAAQDVTPIRFLDCWVYLLDHPELGRQGYLVEKQLDIRNYKYQKWNDNAGRVGNETWRPQAKSAVLPEEEPCNLEAIAEGDDESTDDEGEANNDDNDSECGDGEPGNDENVLFKTEDIPQAFSHFSYHYSKKKFLVCDLQGVFNTTKRTFELTDPVIHYNSSRDRRYVYGRTDKGKAGIDAFFATHKCTPLCEMIRKRHQPYDLATDPEFDSPDFHPDEDDAYEL